MCGGGKDEESELNLQLSGMSMYGAMVRLYGRESRLAPPARESGLALLCGGGEDEESELLKRTRVSRSPCTAPW